MRTSIRTPFLSASIVGAILLHGCQGCSPRYNLGSGFYVTYVDIADLRGVYYDMQGINGDIGVVRVVYNDSIILASGYEFLPQSNEHNKARVLHYGVDKQLYKNNPDQQKSEGYLGLLSDEQCEEVSKRLDDAKTKEW